MTQVTDETLDGLNEEDMKILKDLEADGHEVAGLTPAQNAEETKPEEESQEEAPKEEEPKQEAEPQKDAQPDKKEPEKETEDRKPRYIPAWELKKQEKQWEAEKARLEAELEQARQAKTPAEAEDDVDAIAKKYDLEPSVVKDLVEIAAKRALPPEFRAKLQEFEEVSKATKATLEEQAFSKDFASQVEPLVRAEYPDISDDALAKIREDIKSHAYSKDFLTTPLHVIYKGVDSFRGRVQPKTKTVEGKRGGEGRTDVVDFDSLTEDQVQNLSGEDFIKYSEYQARKERN